MYPSAQFPIQKLNFGNNTQNVRKSSYECFLVLFSFTEFLYFVSNIFSRIVQKKQIFSHDSIFSPPNFQTFQKLNFGNNNQKVWKSRYQNFLLLSSFTGFLYHFVNILSRTADLKFLLARIFHKFFMNSINEYSITFFQLTD